MNRTSVGAMRHRLLLEEIVRTDDGGGEAIETWSPVAEVWAAIEPVSGDERAQSEALAGRITHVIHIRHRPGIVPAMRFLRGNRRFEILAVMDIDERRHRLRCLCIERDL